MLKAQRFKDVYEGRCLSVNHNPNVNMKFADNQHILQ